ncbi:SDR family NAD(P)-dependent oxidoreductase [Xanthomonas campestris]|uniref:SDR family NAD(P)-dependent oxidoreductase n=1 Tax=Xanthomonas campestris TaxID=339 RepID=UPI000E327FDC|nr:SDR family NAD(P)-dependent oxidoreductase [Xanthomonas campestris]MEA9489813.1 SDR family NAD(P)-dependent oxidoreductase [Xanthomonas campestris]MEA9508195.1 SDR family NAD(P)-dependent oxidoreductase [Xanthomonas campestris]MEA9574976.1 SDR family NAD(P)-dependent oxidoreductase [Xanthomonas campestris]MEB2111447.1 SDR family NAD(P)-dependent oxidoreductase [Xanthomonas campestris pv. campestris]RFF69828.1 SDR family oxidoreductase [Xanthomonas campestris pv. campestris]
MSTPPPQPQRVLIAGGSRGIGLAIAQAFVQSGAQVSLCARNPNGLADAAAQLAAHGAPVHTFACDLADAAQIERYVHAAAQAFGGLDVVVNNASGYGHGNDDESWQAGLDVDLMAAVRCNRAAVPYLRQSGDAVILNISSINGQRPTPRAIAYSTAKAALNYYTTTLAAELARERIRVNAIAPGSIEFPGGLWEQRSRDEPALYARIRDSIPFGGFGQVQHVADAALFLASPQARWITGQVLAVDGGQSLGV